MLRSGGAAPGKGEGKGERAGPDAARKGLRICMDAARAVPQMESVHLPAPAARFGAGHRGFSPRGKLSSSAADMWRYS
jgi:hypothetical protein